jgi:hypothetical protein
MTPYELRFNIFKEAECLADRQHQSEYAAVQMWNEISSEKKEYPKFPTFEYIQELANQINNFVSSK